MDFMPCAGTVAVPYDLVPARDPQHTYDLPGAQWAEARIGEAAAALAMLAGDPARRAAMGAAAREAGRRLAPQAIARNVMELLSQS
jgi:hypothetical protein